MNIEQKPPTFSEALSAVPMFPLLLALISGILVEDKLLQIYSYRFWALTFLAAIFLLSFLLYFNRFSFWYSQLKTFIGVLLCFLLGAGLTAFIDVRSNPNWYAYHIQEAEAFTVQLTEAPQQKPKTLLLQGQAINYLSHDSLKPATGKILVYVYLNDSMPNYQIGQRLIIPNELVSIKHNNNPFSYNFAEKRKREGIFYQSFLSHQKIIIADSQASISKIANMRAYFLKQLNNHIQDKDTRGLTIATMLNERADLDDFIQQAYSNTGITHIIAISGMHVNIFFMLFTLLLFWLRGEKYKWLKYLLALPLVWLYIFLTGAPPSAVRAAVMFTLLTIAFSINRKHNAVNILFTTGFLMLCYEPMWLYHIGVQLSFLAVLSIFLFYQPIYRLVFVKNKALQWICSTVAVSLAVQILVFPLVIFYFHQFPIWFLPANFFAAMFSVFLMLTAILILILASLGCGKVATFLGDLLGYVTQYFHDTIIWMNRYSPDASRWLNLDAMDYWLMMLSILLLSVFWLMRKKMALFLGLLLMLFFIGNLILQDFLAAKQERLVVYSNNNHSLLSYIKGRTVKHFSDTALSDQQERFVLKPALLGFRVNKTAPPFQSSFKVRIGPDEILFLNGVLENVDTQKVAYLIVSKNVLFEPEKWLQIYQPQQVVIDNSLPRWKANKWASSLRENNVAVHNVREDGAWVYSGKIKLPQ